MVYMRAAFTAAWAAAAAGFVGDAAGCNVRTACDRSLQSETPVSWRFNMLSYTRGGEFVWLFDEGPFDISLTSIRDIATAGPKDFTLNAADSFSLRYIPTGTTSGITTPVTLAYLQQLALGGPNVSISQRTTQDVLIRFLRVVDSISASDSSNSPKVLTLFSSITNESMRFDRLPLTEPIPGQEWTETDPSKLPKAYPYLPVIPSTYFVNGSFVPLFDGAANSSELQHPLYITIFPASATSVSVTLVGLNFATYEIAYQLSDGWVTRVTPQASSAFPGPVEILAAENRLRTILSQVNQLAFENDDLVQFISNNGNSRFSAGRIARRRKLSDANFFWDMRNTYTIIPGSYQTNGVRSELGTGGNVAISISTLEMVSGRITVFLRAVRETVFSISYQVSDGWVTRIMTGAPVVIPGVVGNSASLLAETQLVNLIGRTQQLGFESSGQTLQFITDSGASRVAFQRTGTTGGSTMPPLTVNQYRINSATYMLNNALTPLAPSAVGEVPVQLRLNEMFPGSIEVQLVVVNAFSYHISFQPADGWVTGIIARPNSALISVPEPFRTVEARLTDLIGNAQQIAFERDGSVQFIKDNAATRVTFVPLTARMLQAVLPSSTPVKAYEMIQLKTKDHAVIPIGAASSRHLAGLAVPMHLYYEPVENSLSFPVGIACNGALEKSVHEMVLARHAAETKNGNGVNPLFAGNSAVIFENGGSTSATFVERSLPADRAMHLYDVYGLDDDQVARSILETVTVVIVGKIPERLYMSVSSDGTVLPVEISYKEDTGRIQKINVGEGGSSELTAVLESIARRVDRVDVSDYALVLYNASKTGGVSFVSRDFGSAYGEGVVGQQTHSPLIYEVITGSYMVNGIASPGFPAVPTFPIELTVTPKAVGVIMVDFLIVNGVSFEISYTAADGFVTGIVGGASTLMAGTLEQNQIEAILRSSVGAVQQLVFESNGDLTFTSNAGNNSLSWRPKTATTTAAPPSTTSAVVTPGGVTTIDATTTVVTTAGTTVVTPAVDTTTVVTPAVTPSATTTAATAPVTTVVTPAVTTVVTTVVTPAATTADTTVGTTAVTPIVTTADTTVVTTPPATTTALPSTTLPPTTVPPTTAPPTTVPPTTAPPTTVPPTTAPPTTLPPTTVSTTAPPGTPRFLVKKGGSYMLNGVFTDLFDGLVPAPVVTLVFTESVPGTAVADIRIDSNTLSASYQFNTADGWVTQIAGPTRGASPIVGAPEVITAESRMFNLMASVQQIAFEIDGTIQLINLSTQTRVAFIPSSSPATSEIVGSLFAAEQQLVGSSRTLQYVSYMVDGVQQSLFPNGSTVAPVTVTLTEEGVGELTVVIKVVNTVIYTIRYNVEDGWVSQISQGISTLMAGPPDLMEVERKVSAMIGATQQIGFNGDIVQFISNYGRNRIAFGSQSTTERVLTLIQNSYMVNNAFTPLFIDGVSRSVTLRVVESIPGDLLATVNLENTITARYLFQTADGYVTSIPSIFITEMAASSASVAFAEQTLLELMSKTRQIAFESDGLIQFISDTSRIAFTPAQINNRRALQAAIGGVNVSYTLVMLTDRNMSTPITQSVTLRASSPGHARLLVSFVVGNTISYELALGQNGNVLSVSPGATTLMMPDPATAALEATLKRIIGGASHVGLSTTQLTFTEGVGAGLSRAVFQAAPGSPPLVVEGAGTVQTTYAYVQNSYRENNVAVPQVGTDASIQLTTSRSSFADEVITTTLNVAGNTLTYLTEFNRLDGWVRSSRLISGTPVGSANFSESKLHPLIAEVQQIAFETDGMIQYIKDFSATRAAFLPINGSISPPISIQPPRVEPTPIQNFVFEYQSFRVNGEYQWMFTWGQYDIRVAVLSGPGFRASHFQPVVGSLTVFNVIGEATTYRVTMVHEAGQNAVRVSTVSLQTSNGIPADRISTEEKFIAVVQQTYAYEIGVNNLVTLRSRYGGDSSIALAPRPL